ncbi:MAG: TIR domain-containing protein [Syntrophobacteraceae bacterium]|jgi:hypothetical protein
MSTLLTNPFLSGLQIPTKRKIFVSYHHGNDQWYYDKFSRFFSDVYDIIRDNSLDRRIDSDNSDYVMRNIRENFITGSSCTFVLCGAETFTRKFVDWEIKATLDKQHGLIGINLPSSRVGNLGGVIVPDRLHENITSGYALWVPWADITINPASLSSYIELANAKSKSLIKNNLPLKVRNGQW